MIDRETLFISNITIPAHRARGLNPDAVARLAESIKRIGCLLYTSPSPRD